MSQNTTNFHYKRTSCQFCKERITTGGAAYVAHMRMHVREGIAREIHKKHKHIFISAKNPPTASDFHYKKSYCQHCKDEISTGGAAYVAHMRMHVRKGILQEFKTNKKLTFILAGPPSTLIQKHPYAKLGEDPLPGQSKETWDISEALAELKGVNPSDYFITSGEAVRKAEKLVQDLYSLAMKARAFRDRLKRARGKKKYLETNRENNLLLCKCKDPRERTDVNNQENKG
jgi:hypothetical protein